jgi:hypothetical protein
MSIFAPHRFAMTVWRPLLVWVLALALPINAVSSLTNLLLGTSHRHVAAAPSVDVPAAVPLALQWHELLRAALGNEVMSLIDAQHERLAQRPASLAQQALHAHLHDTFQRHVHDVMDGSVVALGDKGLGEQASSSQSADTSSPQWHQPEATLEWPTAWVLTAWPQAHDTPYVGPVPLLLERPPKA